MPIKHIKSRTKKQYSMKNKMYQPMHHPMSQPIHQHQNLIDLISMISQARKNKSKSQSNLPARLMKMNRSNKINMTSMPSMINMQKPKSYAKLLIICRVLRIFRHGLPRTLPRRSAQARPRLLFPE